MFSPAEETTELSFMNELWFNAPVVLKFNIPGMELFSLNLSGMVLNAHFTAFATDSSLPTVPFEEFPAGVEAVWIPSFPVNTRLSRFSFQSSLIRYVPWQYRRCWVDLHGTFEEYAQTFSPKSRSTLRRKVRKFARLCGGHIPWRMFSAPEEMEEFYRDARRISSLTYQERLWNSGLPEGEEFRRQMMDGAVRGDVRGYILYYGMRPVAFMFCRARDGFLLYEYVGYDPYFRTWSPGVVLLYLALKQLFKEARFQAFDFGPKDSPHKVFFSNRSMPCADIYYLPRKARFLFLLCVHSALEVFSDATRSLLGLLGLRVATRRLIRSNSGVFGAVSAMVARVVRNPLMDLRYGAILKGVERSRFEQLGAVETCNSDYAVLPKLFANLVGQSDVLVDVGCGKGRVINWWLSQGWRNKLIGIELDPQIAKKTRARLRKYPTVTILAGDVNENIPTDGTIFYLYHPFHWHVMERFKNRLLENFGERGGTVLVYYNCLCIDLFKKDSRWEVEELDLRHPGAHPAAIIRMKPAAGPIPPTSDQIVEATLAEHRK